MSHSHVFSLLIVNLPRIVILNTVLEVLEYSFKRTMPVHISLNGILRCRRSTGPFGSFAGEFTNYPHHNYYLSPLILLGLNPIEQAWSEINAAVGNGEKDL
jgi:hypothetical protein